MSKIKINDKWSIRFDGDSYMPEYWREAYTADNGKEVVAKWMHCGKYYPTLASSIRYMVDQDVLSKGDMSLNEFLVEYKGAAEELSQLVKKAVGGVK